MLRTRLFVASCLERGVNLDPKGCGALLTNWAILAEITEKKMGLERNQSLLWILTIGFHAHEDPYFTAQIHFCETESCPEWLLALLSFDRGPYFPVPKKSLEWNPIINIDAFGVTRKLSAEEMADKIVAGLRANKNSS